MKKEHTQKVQNCIEAIRAEFKGLVKTAEIKKKQKDLEKIIKKHCEENSLNIENITKILMCSAYNTDIRVAQLFTNF